MARVRLFANLREVAGTTQVDIDGGTVGEVVDGLVARYGADFQQHLGTARIWKNGLEGVAGDPVTDDDELAVIPPVSGGQTMSAMEGGGGLETLKLAGVTLLLLGANVLGPGYLVALWVGVAAMWIMDLAMSSSDGDFRIDYPPLLAAVLVSMAASSTFGLAGLGIGAALSVAMVMGCAIARPSARDLTMLAASSVAALIASLSVSSILLARVVASNGERTIAGLLIITILGAVIGQVTDRSRSRLISPYTMASIVMVLAALAVANLSDLPSFGYLRWFFIGLVMAFSVIAGRGIGSAFRTGQIQMAARPGGALASFDGPMLAVAAFFPLVG